MNGLAFALIVALTNGFGRVEVDTLGAHVMSYVPAGSSEVLFRQPDSRVPGVWYHGGIPVCWPWFGRNGPEGSELHGLVRDRDWTVVSRTDSRLELGLEECGCRLVYEVVLGEGLSLGLRMTNIGPDSRELTMGLHPYFSISHPTNVVVKMPDADIRCHGNMDGGLDYGEGSYALIDEGSHRRIDLDFHGNNRVVIWNCGIEDPLDGMRPEDWSRYLCVEPAVMPRASGVRLGPKQKHVIGMRIKVNGEAMTHGD